MNRTLALIMLVVGGGCPLVAVSETVFRAGTDGSLVSEDGSVSFQARCFAKGWLGKDARLVNRTHDGGPAIPFKIDFGQDANGAVISGIAGFLADAADIHARWTLSVDREVELEQLYVGVTLPFDVFEGGSYELDGKRADFPKPNAEHSQFGYAKDVRSVALRGRKGRVTTLRFDHPVAVMFQDSTPWKGTSFDLRLMLSKAALKPGALAELGCRITTSDGARLVMPRKVTLAANDEWLPFAVAPGVKKGSALDFATVSGVDAPAGKYGHVIVRNGHFAFEKRPDRPVRFYGVNLCFNANYVDFDDAKAFADRLAHLGYNALRIHHYERDLVEGSADGTTLNPRRMRQLDGLLAACVEAGVYVTTDLFVSRPVPWRALGENRNGLVPMDEFKAMVRTNEAAYANLEKFTRALLGHVNVYTGRRWADEPALAFISLVNENNLGNHGGIPEGPARKAAADLERAFYARMERLLHQEIGTKALLTDMNGWTNYDEYRACRKDYDYVDNHFYVDHPRFLERDWQLPSSCPNENPLKGRPRGAPGAGAIREPDKPFTITEWNYSAPGRYRGVGGIFTGAWAAREGWDGLWRFAWSHGDAGIVKPETCRLGYFDMAGDPLSLASERATMCLFLRGDLATGDQQAMKVDSETGSLTLVTPRTSGGFAERGTIRAGVLTAALDSAPATVWASSVDGKALGESSRILLTHLTDVQNTGAQYADDSFRVLLGWGGLPHLMRRGRAEVRLTTKATKVYALRGDGERAGEVAARRDGNALVFTLDTAREAGAATYLYEIVAEK